MPPSLRRALLCLGAFLLPAALFRALGPAGGFLAALIGAVALVFGVRRTGALLAGASLAAGTAWHGFLRPLRLYRTEGLSPRALVGTDGQGGVFVRSRTGAVFHAGADGSWERVPLPPGLSLGRVGMSRGVVQALEIRPEGDRLWRVEGTSVGVVAVGRGETVLVADWDFDGATPVAVDAPGRRLVWVGPDGGLARAVRPPPEAGAPRLVATGGGGVHVYADGGAILSLSPKGNWSVLRLPPPPGRAAALSHAGGRFTLLMRAERDECSAWDLTGGVSGRWRRREEEGPCPRFTADAEKAYRLDRRGVTATPRSGPPTALGPPRALTRSFDRTPVGAGEFLFGSIVAMSAMTKNKPEWVVPFGLLGLAAAAGVLASPAAPVVAGGPLSSGDTAWMLTATALVLLMTPGLSFFYGGMVQKKNVISTMLQSFIAMGVVSVLWVAVGFSLAFGDSLGGLVGDPRTFLMFRGVGGSTHPDLAPTIPLALFALFQLKFAIITPALITGSFAERVRFSSYILFITLFTLVVYCPLAHWTWHPKGFLRVWGVLDFAGGTVVHLSAGFAALAGALFLGRRKVHVAAEPHVPANIPFVMLGTGMLWFGWFGFNAGSALAANETAVLAFLTTNTASAAAMLAWVLFDAVRGRRPSALGAAIGAVVGLVAITPAAGYVTVGQSVFIGFVSSLVSNMAVHWKSRSTLDDTLDVFPCHGVGGIVGMLMTAVFAKDGGLVYGDAGLFLSHLKALVIAGAFSFALSYALYALTDAVITLRVRPEQEEAGLDRSQHAESVA